MNRKNRNDFRWRCRLAVLAIAAVLLFLPSLKAEAASKKKVYQNLMNTVSSMVKKNPAKKVNGFQSTEKYATMRLIVRTKNNKVNLRKFGASSVIKGMDRLYFLQFKSIGAAKNAEKKIRKQKGVVYVEPDRVVGVSGTAEGKEYEPYTWGVKETGLADFSNYVASVTSKSIKVAVVDTGISNHPRLEGRLGKGVNPFANTSNARDALGHGTHIAGIIADCTPARNVTIIPVRICDDDYPTASQIFTGIVYASEILGAKVINLSLCSDEKMNVIEDGIKIALGHNCVVVVSAGNGRADIDKVGVYPANSDEVITVGALDSNGKRWYKSNYGKSLDVVAPGVDILSTGLNGSMDLMSGTSQAAPYVTALAAELCLLYPKKTAVQIRQLITECAKDLGKKGWDKYYGYGLIQAPTVYTRLSFKKSSVTLTAGDKKKLEYTLKNKFMAGGKTVWKSSDSSIAAVSSSGVVTAIREGTVKVSVSACGKTASCTVKIKGYSTKQKALLTYAETLEKRTALYGDKKYMACFGLIDLDGNDIPELVAADTLTNHNSFTLCGVNGKILDLYDLFDVSTGNHSVRAWYYPKTGVLFATIRDDLANDAEGIAYILDYQYAYLPKGGIKVTGFPEFPYSRNEWHYSSGNITDNYMKYSGINEKISKETFETEMKKYTGGTAPEAVRLYKNTAANRSRYLGV